MLKNMIGINSPPGSVGIEVEVEFSVAPNLVVPITNWNVKNDGSLRNHGFEFVSKKAFTLDKKRENLARLFAILDTQPVIRDCPRASVHVHINCLDLKPAKLMSAIVGSWLVDTTMMELCGQRRGNQYCLTIADAEAQIRNAERMAKDFTNVVDISADGYKYSAVNLASLGRFGTLEFRGMEATIDTDRVDKWSSLCYDVVHSSKFETPSDLMDACLSQPTDDFLEKLVGGSKQSLEMLTSVKKRDELIADNADILLKLAYMNDDWRKWSDAIEKKYPPRNQRPAYQDALDDMPLPNPDADEFMQRAEALRNVQVRFR